MNLLDNKHKGLFSHFLERQGFHSEFEQDIWSKTLGKPYLQVISEFIDEDLLTRPPLVEILDFFLKIPDIKPILREHGFKASGKKAELVKRLIEQLPDVAREKAAKSNLSEETARTLWNLGTLSLVFFLTNLWVQG
ncbi:MAG: SAP domain-containing protein [Promethearchaeota archaeon]